MRARVAAARPAKPPRDVLSWRYTDNKLDCRRDYASRRSILRARGQHPRSLSRIGSNGCGRPFCRELFHPSRKGPARLRDSTPSAPSLFTPVWLQRGVELSRCAANVAGDCPDTGVQGPALNTKVEVWRRESFLVPAYAAPNHIRFHVRIHGCLARYLNTIP